jgi:acetaldehyde dehydrogenase (acetylating)
MHTQDRAAAIRYGQQMPAARVIINSPTTHGAIGFSTDLAPSMTLGCGSWGGNVTSDNISPHHLMDIKRVAFETKPVNAARAAGVSPSTSAAPPRARANREDIAAIVDSFLSKRVPELVTEKPAEPAVPAETKAIVHEITPENAVQKPVPITPVEFVSEDDVRRAINAGQKIYVSKKTIVTPSARDLGDEKEVFATI